MLCDNRGCSHANGLTPPINAPGRRRTEFAFDSSRGDPFVVRVAGNFVNDDNVATFEYGFAVLNSPLIMVLGHSSRGAVISTVKSIDTNTTLPGHLPSMVTALAPAVNAARSEGGDLVANATKANVRMNVERLKAASPILEKAIAEKEPLVVGGYYDLATGIVELVTCLIDSG